MKSRHLSWLFATAALGATGLAQADYPERPITLVVNSTAGSPLDVMARLIAEAATEDLDQPIIVEAKPGASGTIGGGYVSRADPDGYTLLLALDITATAVPYVSPNPDFNAMNDLEFIHPIGDFSQALVVPPKLGVENIDEFMAVAKENNLTYASAGIGSPGHLTMASFADAADLDMTHIPYKGNPPAVNDMLAGLVDSGFLVVAGVVPHVKSGAFVPLAVSGTVRNDLLPDTPTVQESGIPGTEEYSSTFGYLFAAPKGTPPEIIEQWNELLTDVLQRPGVKERFEGDLDIALRFDDPAQTRKHIEEQAEHWKGVIEEAGISAQN